MDFAERGCLNLKKCFGIISYFPGTNQKENNAKID